MPKILPRKKLIDCAKKMTDKDVNDLLQSVVDDEDHFISEDDWAAAMADNYYCEENNHHQTKKEKTVKKKSTKKQKSKSKKIESLGNVGVNVLVQFGNTKLTLDEISCLSRGSVIELNQFAGSHLTVFANDQPVAYAEPVVVNDKFGIRLVEILI